MIPLTLGPGPAFRPPPFGAAVAGRAPVKRLRCGPRPRERIAAHLELFARRHVVLIPAGIGVAPPQARDGARVRAGACWYPVHTVDPSGLIEIDSRRRVTLGELFDVWGEPLSGERLASFRAPRGSGVLAFVDGRRWRGDPRSVRIRRHATLVLEVGGYVPPHRVYRYPPGM